MSFLACRSSVFFWGGRAVVFFCFFLFFFFFFFRARVFVKRISCQKKLAQKNDAKNTSFGLNWPPKHFFFCISAAKNTSCGQFFLKNKKNWQKKKIGQKKMAKKKKLAKKKLAKKNGQKK